MNDKAKKVLSYVACAIGGACLGIALLGGLSYCSTSSAREKTDTINTIDRVKHNELITTDEGGYTGYQFDVSSRFDDFTIDNGMFYYDLYSVDTSTYTLTPYLTHNYIHLNRGFNSLVSVINERYEWASNLSTNNVLFFACWFKFSFSTSSSVEMNLPGAYFSFVLPQVSTSGVAPMTFIYTNSLTTDSLARLDFDASLGGASPTLYMLNGGKTPYFVWNGSSEPPENPTFQDIVSYYKDLGYQEGSSAGYESGYDKGFQEGYMNTYYAFTSLIVNRNAIWSMANIPWHSNNDIYIAPGHLNDHPFLDPAILQTNTYVNWAYLALFRDTTTLIPYYIYAQRYTTSQNNGYVNFIIRISPADQTSTENAGNIGSYSGGVSLSETSIFQTETVTEWTAPNRCQLIAWGSDNPQDIDTNWFDSGHILPRGIAVDESAYDQGYKQGQLDAQRNTNMNNVFALFTPAFGAVASFFDMKIFGFLPLYWFLIAPLFIALISLIMRMVKH